MYDLIETICEKFNCPDWLQGEFLILFLSLGIILGFIKLLHDSFKKLRQFHKQYILSKDLHPYYSKADVISATKYYIPVKYQNVAPSDDEEIGRKFISSAKEKLIPLFVNKIFSENEGSSRYFLILADSGMGKTTLLINLYISYKRSLKYRFSTYPYQVRLVPVGWPNILKQISNFQDKENTILLLDALDEDLEAIRNYDSRFKKILEVTESFRKVVITCRTQFFPSEADEPHHTGYFSYGQGGEYKFEKLYLSVFSDKDVKKYLNKRFSLLHLKKRKIAFKIAKKSPNLIVRPMLLSYINDLVNSKKSYEFSIHVYEELIKKWIERESEKPEIVKKYSRDFDFKSALHAFSMNIAWFMYNNRDVLGGFIIPSDFEDQKDKFGQITLRDLSYGLDDGIAKSKSLLNRDAQGNYKFAHKSIFEYFIAIRLMHERRFRFDYSGMDMVKEFHWQLKLIDLRNISGFFQTDQDNLKIDLNKLDQTNLTRVTVLHFSFVNFHKVELIRDVLPDLRMSVMSSRNFSFGNILRSIYKYFVIQNITNEETQFLSEFDLLNYLEEKFSLSLKGLNLIFSNVDFATCDLPIATDLRELNLITYYDELRDKRHDSNWVFDDDFDELELENWDTENWELDDSEFDDIFKSLADDIEIDMDMKPKKLSKEQIQIMSKFFELEQISKGSLRYINQVIYNAYKRSKLSGFRYVFKFLSGRNNIFRIEISNQTLSFERKN